MCSNDHPGCYECSTLKASLCGAGLLHAATYVSSAVINTPSEHIRSEFILCIRCWATNNKHSPFPDGLQASVEAKYRYTVTEMSSNDSVIILQRESPQCCAGAGVLLVTWGKTAL